MVVWAKPSSAATSLQKASILRCPPPTASPCAPLHRLQMGMPPTTSGISAAKTSTTAPTPCLCALRRYLWCSGRRSRKPWWPATTTTIPCSAATRSPTGSIMCAPSAAPTPLWWLCKASATPPPKRCPCCRWMRPCWKALDVCSPATSAPAPGAAPPASRRPWPMPTPTCAIAMASAASAGAATWCGSNWRPGARPINSCRPRSACTAPSAKRISPASVNKSVV